MSRKRSTKTRADDSDEREAKRARLSEELSDIGYKDKSILDSKTRVLSSNPTPHAVLVACYVDDVLEGRREQGGLRDFIDRYIAKPVYRSARVSAHVENPWGHDFDLDDVFLPIEVAFFLDLLKPEISVTRSKHDHTELEWEKDIFWSPDEAKPSCTAQEWEEKGGRDNGYWDQVYEHPHGWEAWRYFLAHYQDEDRDEKTQEILDREETA